MSETTNLKLFKHDNPSTNTNPFDVEQALNDNWNKIDTAVGDLQDDIKENNTNITNIDTRLTTAETDLETAKTDITNIKAEQTTQNNNIEANSTAIETNAEAIEQNKEDITDLQEENANLRAQIPTGTAAGEEISLSDSAEMELVDFGLQGNSYQEVNEGKNKAIIPDKEENFHSMAINIKNGVITITGTSDVTYTSYKVVGTAKLEAGKKYYLRLWGSKSGSATLFKDSENQWFPDSENQEYEFTPTVGGTYNIQLGFGGGENQNWNARYSISETSNSDWVEGKEATPTLVNPSVVQAVGDSGSVEIVKSNKNLLDFGYDSVAGITFNKNKVTIKNPNSYNYVENFNLKANKVLSGKKVAFTYVINGEVTGDNYVDLIFNSNKRSYIVQKQANKSHGTYTNEIFTKAITFANDEYLTGCVVWTAGTTCDLTIYVQIEISDEASDFIEHEGNTYTIPIQKPFYKLGDYKDKFVKQDGKWYEQHNIALFDLSTTNWYAGSVQSGKDVKTKRWNSVNTTSNYIIYDNEAISNYFNTNLSSTLWGTDLIGFNLENNKVNIRLPVETASSADEVKTFWQEKAQTQVPYIYYILATPELIECTEEQTQILDQIIKDGTYKEVTHFYTTEDLKPTLNVKYYKDLETLFKNQASIQATLNNVQAQLLEIGGK